MCTILGDAWNMWPTSTVQHVPPLHSHRLPPTIAIKTEESLPLLTALSGWRQPAKYSAVINRTERSEAADSEISVFCGVPNVPPCEGRARKPTWHTADYRQAPRLHLGLGQRELIRYCRVLAIRPLFWYSVGLISRLVFGLSVTILS